MKPTCSKIKSASTRKVRTTLEAKTMRWKKHFSLPGLSTRSIRCARGQRRSRPTGAPCPSSPSSCLSLSPFLFLFPCPYPWTSSTERRKTPFEGLIAHEEHKERTSPKWLLVKNTTRHPFSRIFFLHLLLNPFPRLVFQLLISAQTGFLIGTWQPNGLN